MRLPYTLLGLATITFAAALAACGGGGHASVVPGAAAPVTAGGGASAQTASVTVSVSVPGLTTSTAIRRRQYVGAGTQSMTVAATAVISPTPTAPPPSPGASAVPAFVPTPSATADVNCTLVTPSPTSTAAPANTCTATLTGVPVGVDSFTVNLYDAPAPGPSVPQGNLISSGTAVQAITTAPASVKLTFNGVPVAVQLTPVTNPIPNPSATPTAASYQVAMSAQDADGYTIVGSQPGSLNSAYSFGTSQSADVTLTPATLATPGAMLTLGYDGKLAAGTVVQLYAVNPQINNGAQMTAGTVLIGPATPASTPSPVANGATSVPGGGPTPSTFPIVFNNTSGITGTHHRVRCRQQSDRQHDRPILDLADGRNCGSDSNAESLDESDDPAVGAGSE